MSKDKEVQKVAVTICRHGLGVAPASLAPGEWRTLLSHARRLLEEQKGVEVDEIVQAIRYGMRKVWPFTEEFRTFDGKDVLRNITKAKGAAATLRTAGLIPMPAREAIESMDRIVDEYE